MLEIVSEKYELKIGGEVYSMDYPYADAFDSLIEKSQDQDNKGKELKMMRDFFLSHGLDEKAVSKLQIQHYNQIFESMMPKKLTSTGFKNAKLARFYGFSNSELKTMSLKDKHDYFNSMNKIRAGEMINEIQVSTFKILKDKKDKDKMWSGLLEGSAFEDPKEMDASEIAKALGFK